MLWKGETPRRIRKWALFSDKRLPAGDADTGDALLKSFNDIEVSRLLVCYPRKLPKERQRCLGQLVRLGQNRDTRLLKNLISGHLSRLLSDVRILNS